jgi:hypothetical protein
MELKIDKNILQEKTAINEQIEKLAKKTRQVSIVLSADTVAKLKTVTGSSQVEVALKTLLNEALEKYVRLKFLEDMSSTKPENISKTGSKKKITKKTTKKR